MAIAINQYSSILSSSFQRLKCSQDQAIKAKASYSGCSVHYVNAKIDSGKIILQKKVKILKKDNTESLSKKILIEEHKVYPRALQMVAKTLLTRQQ